MCSNGNAHAATVQHARAFYLIGALLQYSVLFPDMTSSWPQSVTALFATHSQV